MYVASSEFNYYPSKDTYGDGWTRDYYLRTMFTCSNLDCDYYDRFLCRRHALFIRAFHYKPVCPACSSEVLHTGYWDPTNYRRVFVSGRINREVLPTQHNSNPNSEKSRFSRMIQTLDLSKRLNLKISSDNFTLAFATVAFEYNLEVDLEDLRKIYIINTVINRYITFCLAQFSEFSFCLAQFSEFSGLIRDDIHTQISNLKQITHLQTQIFELLSKLNTDFETLYNNSKDYSTFFFRYRMLLPDLKNKISDLEGVKDKISDFKNIPNFKDKISDLTDKVFDFKFDFKHKISDLEKEPFSDNHRELLSDLKGELSNFKDELSNFKDEISDLEDKISDFKVEYYPDYDFLFSSFDEQIFYDSPFSFFDEQISQIKDSLSDSSINEIAKCLSPHLIDPTSLR